MYEHTELVPPSQWYFHPIDVRSIRSRHQSPGSP
jgi:hypothetical protein